MEINGKQRITEIQDMRSKLAQGYLKMVAADNWFEVVKNFVCVNPQYSDNLACIELYGPEKYTIDMMDCSLMNGLVSYCKEFKRHVIPSKIFNSLINILDDRNYQAHVNSNESEYELYSFSLHQLYNLKKFIKLVLSKDDVINYEIRAKYFGDWIIKLNYYEVDFLNEYVQVLLDYIEYEKIEVVLLESNHPDEDWNRILVKEYEKGPRNRKDRCFKFTKLAYDFVLKNPNVFIKEVYKDALIYLSANNKFCELQELMVEYFKNLTGNNYSDIKYLIGCINKLIVSKNDLSEDFENVVKSITKKIYVDRKNNKKYLFISAKGILGVRDYIKQ